MLSLAGQSMSAPPSSSPLPACTFGIKGSVNERGQCATGYRTYPPADGGFPFERTALRIAGGGGLLDVEIDFWQEPHVGQQLVGLDAGSNRSAWVTVRIERNGQQWEARSQNESDFSLTFSSVKATCNDGGLKCWEIHGSLQANVPSALLSPFAPPLPLSMSF